MPLGQYHPLVCVSGLTSSKKHPFHLHGHAFQVVYRSEEEAGAYLGNETFAPLPMRRDTVLVKPNGNMVLRFRADNPGVWLFHCHIEWHVASGLVATMIEAPLALQKILPLGAIPQDHLEACRQMKSPFSGNAAGNTVDLQNLDGENRAPNPLPAGFTAKGIVALVFSCIAAFLGLATISWYGAAPIGVQRVSNSNDVVARPREGAAEGNDAGGAWSGSNEGK
jgi:iron transport multicopper oxidase